MVSALTGLPAIFVRKQAKTYGTCKLAEGGDFSRRTVTLIEDIITTGGAARNAATALHELDATVHTSCAPSTGPNLERTCCARSA